MRSGNKAFIAKALATSRKKADNRNVPTTPRGSGHNTPVNSDLEINGKQTPLQKRIDINSLLSKTNPKKDPEEMN